MDDPGLNPEEHIQALRGLERIHAISGTTGRMWRAIRGWYACQRFSQVTVMDVGCGNAALLRNLWTRAQRHGLSLQLVGCDFSSRALQLAESACGEQEIPIQLHEIDIRRKELPVQADVVVSTLFLHHFTEHDATNILRQLAAASRHLMLVEDLIRSRLGYALCRVGVNVLSRSRVVHHDGPQSVRASFTIHEMRRLLAAAACHSATVRRCWPERLFVNYTISSQPAAGAVHA
jgi:2-polyprenyl-3-methyl-5-hydroxy-6-metoxy-1,4-benzoquinol methylase